MVFGYNASETAKYQGGKKFGGGNLMVWGVLTKKGVGKIIRINNTMNSGQYCNVLKEGLLETINMHELKISELIFMQDNASCHKSKETSNWHATNNIETLNWPACSPDLNIIENVWAYLEKCLRKRNLKFKNDIEMWKIIEEEWYKIPKAFVDKLYWSMCIRIKQVIVNKGDITKY